MFKKLIVLICLSTTISSFGQFGLIKKQLLDKAKNKDLIVVLKNENPEDFENKDKDLGLKFNILYNKVIKEELKKYWKLSNGRILFKKESDILDISQSEIKNYIFLKSGWSIKVNEVQGDFLMYSFTIETQNENGEKSTIFELSYAPDKYISNADIIFVSKVLNNHIDASNSLEKYRQYFNIENNIKTVENKTLLLDENLTELSLEKAEKAYKYNLIIEAPENIAKEIVSESAEHLFIRLIWSNSIGAALYDAFDTKNCDIVSCIGTGGFRFSLGFRGSKFRGPGGTSNFFDPQKYPYSNTGQDRKGLSFELYRSEIFIKKIHLKTMRSKLAQKINCR